jgi:hypothetical protein
LGHLKEVTKIELEHLAIAFSKQMHQDPLEYQTDTVSFVTFDQDAYRKSLAEYIAPIVFELAKREKDFEKILKVMREGSKPDRVRGYIQQIVGKLGSTILDPQKIITSTMGSRFSE